jgi:uncharacterized protein YfaS (alpha-2-macroglobulin family)
MKNYSKIAMIVAIFAALGVLVQIAPASAAVNVTITVPDVVAPCATFTVSVKVENTSDTDTITFNKVAAVYVLPDVKYKGPYQVDNQTRQVGPGASTTFSFPFAIRYTQGSIVPLAVALFKDAYTLTGAIGLNVVGVNVSG